MEQVVVGGIVNPAFNWNCIICIKSVKQFQNGRPSDFLTFVEYIAQGTIVQYHDLAQIGLD